MIEVIANTKTQADLLHANTPAAPARPAARENASADNAATDGVAAVVVTLSEQAKSVTRSAERAAAQATSSAPAQSADEPQPSDAISWFAFMKRDAASYRTDTAQRRIAEARKHLEILQRFGGEPEAVARQAKEIERQLRAAALEYAAAVRAEGTVNTTSSATAIDTRA